MVVIAPVLWLLGYITAFYLFPVSDSLQTGFAVSAVMMAIGAVFLSRAPVIKINFLTYAILALWAIAAFSCALSDVKFVSITFLYFFSAFPITFLLFSMMDTSIIFKWLRGILLVLGVSALVQFFWMPEMLKFGGTHWPFSDNNSLGAMLAVGTLLFWGETLRGGKWQHANFIATLVMFASIMTTEGRAVALAFAGVWIVMTMLARPVTKKPVLAFLGAVLIVLGTMTASELSIPHWLTDGAQTIESFQTASVDEPNHLSGSRFMIWKSTIEMFVAHPLTGTGIGTFFIYYPEYRNPLDDSAGYMAHNDLLQFAAEMGFMAPILAVLIVGFVCVQTFKRIRKIENQNDRLNLLIPFSAFVLVVGHSLVNFNFYILPSLMTTGFMLAVWNKQIATREYAVGMKKQVRDICVVFGVFIAFIPLWGVAISEYQVGKAADELGTGNVAAFAHHLNLADTTGLGLNGRAYLQAAIFAAGTKDTKRAVVLLDRAERANPRMAQTYVERSKILQSTDKEAALVQARHAMLINPASLPARVQLADMLERMGQRKESYDVLKAGMIGMMRNPNPQSYYQRVATMALEFGDMHTNKLALERLHP